LTWRPQNPNKWHGFDPEGQLRGWVWRITDERWLATTVTAGSNERVVGRRRTAELAMALVDERTA
jgi:hypothetical protein